MNVNNVPCTVVHNTFFYRKDDHCIEKITFTKAAMFGDRPDLGGNFQESFESQHSLLKWELSLTPNSKRAGHVCVNIFLKTKRWCSIPKKMIC